MMWSDGASVWAAGPVPLRARKRTLASKMCQGMESVRLCGERIVKDAENVSRSARGWGWPIAPEIAVHRLWQNSTRTGARFSRFGRATLPIPRSDTTDRPAELLRRSLFIVWKPVVQEAFCMSGMTKTSPGEIKRCLVKPARVFYPGPGPGIPPLPPVMALKRWRPPLLLWCSWESRAIFRGLEKQRT